MGATGTGYGTFVYNGLDLSTGTDTLEITSEKVRDDASRTVMYHKLTIIWAGVIAGSVDVDMTTFRDRLSQDGAELELKDKGFGRDIHINRPGGVEKDVAFGPKVGPLKWESLGGNKAAKVTWTCEVNLPECTQGLSEARFSGVMALNYSVAHTYNARGSLTRTYTGYIQIALTRDTAIGSKKILDTADAYRRFFQPRAPESFKRTHDWRLNAAKNRVDFSVVDTEIESPNPYPAKIINITGSHKVHWSRANGQAKRFMNTISMNFDRDVGLTGATTWLIFLQLVQQRMNSIQADNAFPFLLELDLTEDLFGWVSDFTIRYRTLGSLEDVVGQTGLWEPIQGTSWQQWRGSLDNSMFHPYGVANIGHLASQDAIVNLCGTVPPVVNGQETLAQPSIGAAQQPLTNGTPPSDVSWVSYEGKVTNYRFDQTVQQSISQSPGEDEPVNQKASADFNYGSGGGTNDIIQEAGRPRYGAIFHGSAIRAGHKIPRPKLDSVGGKTPIERSSKHQLRKIGDYFGQPMYQLDWLIDYSIDNSPGMVAPPKKFEDGD